MSEPIQKPGKSRQDYQTPAAVIEAIANQFGAIGLDMACRTDNMVASRGICEDKGLDALKQDWSDPMYWNREASVIESGATVDVAFCNPPYAHLEPWAKKLLACKWLKRWTLMLVPYSASSLWYVDNVLGKLMVYGVPRIQFVGTDAGYPKDLCIIAAGYGAVGQGYWDWRKSPSAIAQVESSAAE